MGIKLLLVVTSALSLWACSGPTDSGTTSKIENQYEIEQTMAIAYSLELSGQQEAFVAQTFWTDRSPSNLEECENLISKAKGTLTDSLKNYLLAQDLANQSHAEVSWDEKTLSQRIKGVKEQLLLLEDKLLITQLQRTQTAPAP